MARRRKARSGLILLVVLGMLALLSLLSVTYLVFSSESRKAAFQLARGDYRGTPADKLLDQAAHQVIRGTTDSRSALWLNDILGDLYGESTSDPFQTYGARPTSTVTPPPAVYGVGLPAMIQRDNPLRVASSGYIMPPGLTTYNAGSPEAPRLYNGHLLKIPIAWPILAGPNATKLPEQHDAWTGRVVTFLQGPLEGQSFRILRYMGEADIITGSPSILDPTHAANQYSIVIDLNEVRDRVTSKKYGATMITRSVGDWITLFASRNCLDLLFDSVTGTAPNYEFNNPYGFVINAGVTNSSGLGITATGAVDYTPLNPAPGPTPSVYAGTIPDAFLGNHARTRADIGAGYTPAGDSDEPYDAADFQNFFLAMRQADPAVPIAGADASDRITPSFHRQAVINYLMSPGIIPNLSAFSGTAAEKKQFTDYLELLQRATARPLSINVRNFNGPGLDLRVNSSFTGSNPADNRVGFGMRTPQLVANWADNSGTFVMNQPVEIDKFQNWLRFLTRGPWDVDNDGDLVNDSIWMDLNFPLIASPEGKLLKVLAAFYIEDMDGRLDLNAAGSREQADDMVFNAGRANGGANNKYAYLRDYAGPGSNITHWVHGAGYGPADISLRPLFDPPTPGVPTPPTPPTPSPAYGNFLNYRYGSGNSVDSFPGLPSADDPISYLNDRYFSGAGKTTYRAHNPAASPLTGHAANCFPFSVRGRAGIALDLLGNPIYFENDTTFNETVDDPYDSYVIKDRYSDRGISVSDWERLTRYNDVDRSALPSVLQKISTGTLTPGTAGYLSRIRSVSPRNVTLNLPRFSGEYGYQRWRTNVPSPPAQQVESRRVSSFIEFVEAYAQARFPTATARPIFSTAHLRQLFPIEFRHNMALNINRPLGNGTDDEITIPGSPPTVIPPNGVIDEAEEIRFSPVANPFGSASETARYPNGTTTTIVEEYARSGASFDPELEADVPILQARYDGNQPKQFLARHLYCLAQLILPDTYVFANDTTPSITSSLPAAERIKRRARTLAQWAVNVVDFRDADSAMTRFAFDENPFDGSGWNPVDGVVFGVEAPELLITESFAFHDMRIRRRPGSTPPVREQLRIPQGSLFLEFLCPRTTMPAATRGTVDGTIPPAMAGLYEFDSAAPTGTLKLNLGAMTPTTFSPVSFPVWRVVFTKPVADGTGFKDRMTQIYENKTDRFNYTYQFDGVSATGPASTPTARVPWFLNAGSPTIGEPEIDRILWFSGVTPTAANAAWLRSDGTPEPTAPDKIFYGQTGGGSNYLAGGQYLVVGPRNITYLGSRDQGAGARNHRPSRQRIQIVNSTISDWVQFWDMNNDPLFWKTPTPPLVASATPTAAANWAVSANIRNAVTLIAGMDVPSGWTDPTHTGGKIGLNISEPTRNAYYTEPTQFLNSTNMTDDTDTNAPGFANLPKDAYVDTSSSGAGPLPMDRDGSPHAYLQNAGWQPGADADRPAIRTNANWSTAVLQRLADPLRAWDAKYNPYITVDWLPIDLTVFSGEEQFTPDGPIHLATRRKTGALMHPNATTPVNTGATFYSYHNAGSTTPSTALGHSSTPYFDYELQTEYVCRATPPTIPPRDATASFATLGYLNPQFTIRGTVGPPTSTDDYQYTADARYLGTPGPNTFSGMPLNVPLAPYFPNRDFVNVTELTSVPISSPSGFMQDFGVETTPPPAANGLPMFTHTLDFEDLRTPAPSGSPPPLASKLTTGMLLELLATKNPWPDASKIENPAALVVPGYTTATATPEQHAQQSLFEPFRAPQNFLPTYREPGRINLNTLTEDTVFRGLMWNAMTPDSTSSSSWYDTLTAKLTSTSMPYWNEFQNLRRGFAVGTPPVATPIPLANPYLNATYPFEFAHPYTSATAYDKAPLPTMQYDRASHSGLLRRGETAAAPYNMATTTAPNMRLFRADVNNVYPDGGVMGNVPLNTYIRNFPAARLSNLTTDRSSVFAIRITLGYFESDAAGNIGSEYGFDQGESKRHRAVYLIDRSIPVGYQPGQDLNTENVILLRRIIE